MGYSDETDGSRPGSTDGETVSDSQVLAVKAGIVDRLKQWRKGVLRQTQEEYGVHTKLGIGQVKKYESKKAAILPGTMNLLQMAKDGLNLHWLLTGQGRMSASDHIEIVADKPELEVRLKVAEIEAALAKLEPHDQLAVVDALLKTANEAATVAKIQRDWDAMRVPVPTED